MNTLFSSWGIAPPETKSKDGNSGEDEVEDDDIEEVSILEKRSKDPSESVHPFFQPRRKYHRMDEHIGDLHHQESYKNNDDVTELMTVQSQPQPELQPQFDGGQIPVPLPKSKPPPQQKGPVHPFFAKRTISEPAKRSTHKKPDFERDNRQLAAPWPRFQHTRGPITYDRNSTGMDFYLGPRRTSEPQPNCVEIDKSIIEANPFKKASERINVFENSNLSQSQQQQLSNTSYWLSKYSPLTVESIPDKNAVPVKTWIETRINQLKLMPRISAANIAKSKRRKKDELDGFIVDSAEDDEFLHYGGSQPEFERHPHFLILTGGVSTGKTTTVYAAARELDTFVFEVNASARRSNKDLMDLLDGVSQSHLIHSMNRNCVVLFEDVDNLFEDEKTFWQGIMRFSELSRRPIILTCNHLRAIPANVAESSIVASFDPISSEVKQKVLADIAFKESKHVNPKLIEFLSQWDLKSAINNLQLYCCGENWQPDDFVAQSAIAADLGGSQSLENNACDSAAELKSAADVCAAHARTALTPMHESPKDKLLMYEYPDDMIYDEPWEFETRPWTFFLDEKDADKNASAGANARANYLREALYFLSYGRGVYNSIDFAQGGVLSSEIAPYVRQMAQGDRNTVDANAQKMNQVEPTARQTRRVLVSMGIKDQHFDCDVEDLDDILATTIS